MLKGNRKYISILVICFSLLMVLQWLSPKQITEWEKGKFQKLEQKKKIIIGFQNVNLLGQELDKNYDLSLDFQLLNGRLINQFKGLDRNSLINNKLKKWKISFWPSIYSTNENKKLSLIQNKNEVTEIESTERNPNLQKILINQNNELNGTYILRLALNIGSIEIQAVSRKVLIKNKDIVFQIRPDIQNDIYNLYVYDDDGNLEYLWDTAYIPDYKTSVMMNTLFRKN